MKHPKEIVKVIDSVSIDLLNNEVRRYIDAKVAEGFQVVSCEHSRHHEDCPSIEEYAVTLHMREVGNGSDS